MKKIRKFMLRVFFPKRYEKEYVYPVIEKLIRDWIEQGLLTLINPYDSKIDFSQFCKEPNVKL